MPAGQAAASDANGLLGGLVGAGHQHVASGVRSQFSAALEAFKNSGGPEQDKFMAMVNGIADRLSKLGGESRPSGAVGLWPAVGYKPDVSDLEKIGFIFGNGNGGPDIARKQLDLTQTIADKHDITNQLLGTGS